MHFARIGSGHVVGTGHGCARFARGLFSHRLSPGLLSALLLTVSSGALAQALPDAGALQPHIERQKPRLPPAPAPLQSLPEPLAASADLKVTVKQFRFAGNTLLREEQLSAVVAGFLNRPLDFNGLQEAVAAVAATYRASDRLVRVYLPRQDVTDGTVTLQIVESVFGKVRVEGPSSRLKSGDTSAYVTAAQPAGTLVDTAALDRALLLLDELPGVGVSGRLAPGEGQGQTDLVLNVADQPLFSGSLGYDNNGSLSTGPSRFLANAYLNSPTGRGDLMEVNLLHSDGSDYGRLRYSLPVGHQGLRLGGNISRFDYRLVSGDFKALDAKGGSGGWGLDARYPLLRSRARNLFAAVSYADNVFTNKANGAVVTQYGVKAWDFNLLGDFYDTFNGGGANVLGLTLTAGDLNLGRSPSQAQDAATVRTAGSFVKLRYFLSRQQAITPDLALYLSWSGQRAGKNLDSSQKFYLGGADGVRAYPFLEGGGAEGDLINIELRKRLMENVTVAGFYDRGRVRHNVDNNFSGAPLLNHYSLEGVGAFVSWSGPANINVKATYAHRLGRNPSPTAFGTDQDGSLTTDRIWVSAILPL